MLINAILLDMIIEEDNIFSLFFLEIFKKNRSSYKTFVVGLERGPL